MQIVSLVNKKGSVAKTTTAFVLAGSLLKRNFCVLAIDCDAQDNVSLERKISTRPFSNSPSMTFISTDKRLSSHEH